MTIQGVTFKNPVYVESITGEVYELDNATGKSAGGNTTFAQLPTWDSPVMLAERD